MKHSVAIVIPFYKTSLNGFEKISLNQCFKIFADETLIAIKPAELDLSSITQQYPFTNITEFSKQFFLNIEGYNKLMTSEDFYGSFLSYEYILIYQLDAFVFKNELQYWCEQGYDYIGAPWMSDKDKTSRSGQVKDRIVTAFNIFFNIKDKKTKLPLDNQFKNKVGNGGFSLRKVERMYSMIKKHKKLVNFYIENQAKNPYFNEDVFWSIEINRRRKQLNIPSYKKAVFFAFEDGLEKALRLTKGQLPFGCHDWDRNIEFWKPYLHKAGYEV